MRWEAEAYVGVSLVTLVRCLLLDTKTYEKRSLMLADRGSVCMGCGARCDFKHSSVEPRLSSQSLVLY